MENIVFINQTTISEKEHKTLNKLIFISKLLPMVIIYQIMALIFMVYGLILKNYFIAIFFGILFVFFPIGMIFISYLRTIKLYKKYKQLYDNSKYTFEFYDDNVKVDLTYGNSKRNAIIKYSDLTVTETKEYIFLFISATNAYIVNKDGFNNNFDSLGFRSIVQGKAKKYKIKK